MTYVEYFDFEGFKYKRYPNAKLPRRRNYFQRHVKVEGKLTTTYLHREIWKTHHGEIPKGFHIHHKDGNPLNNAIENFECLSALEHRKKHADELGMTISEYYKYVKSKGVSWNKTIEGRNFKSQQAKNIWKNRRPIPMICRFCNKSFSKHSTRGLKNEFCSQNCTKRHGFMTGEYAIEKQCIECSNIFKCRPDKPRLTCSKACQSIQHTKMMKGF